MKVPFIDILRYEPGFYEAVTARTAALIKNGHFIGGPGPAPSTPSDVPTAPTPSRSFSERPAWAKTTRC